MTNHDDEKRPVAMPLEQLRAMAAQVAEEMKSAGDPLPLDVRERFINVRAALFQRGIYDPVLVRFDTVSAPKATVSELGEQLATVAGSL
jgi:hypothetical protein